MPGAGPVRVITDKAILEADPETGELVLAALYPGITADEVARRRRLAAPEPRAGCVKWSRRAGASFTLA